MLRVPVSRLASGEVTLDREASRYVARVHRARVGDELMLFDPVPACEAAAIVLAIDRSGVRCRVGEVCSSPLRARRRVTLVQGMGKGDKLDAIVRDATELGATRVIVAETARGVVKLGDRGEQRMVRLRRIAAESARQCGRGDVPEVLGPLPWTGALERAASPIGLSFCLWERATEPLGPHLRALGAEQPVAFAVGAEGGLEAAEVESARSAGFAAVSLGPFILRTETVAAAVLGAVLLTSAPAPSFGSQ